MLIPLYIALRDRLFSVPLATLAPLAAPSGLMWCDIYNGQLNRLAAENPILFPAIFISINIEWDAQPTQQMQRGRAQVTLYIAQETIGSDTYSNALMDFQTNVLSVSNAFGQPLGFAKINLIDTINQYMQGFSSGSLTAPWNETLTFAGLQRTGTRYEEASDTLRIDTIDYTTQIIAFVPDGSTIPLQAVVLDTQVSANIIAAL